MYVKTSHSTKLSRNVSKLQKGFDITMKCLWYVQRNMKQKCDIWNVRTYYKLHLV